MKIQADPQNPYRSCVVRASAGSGKTYQLSKRFLFLVGAGAHPASIMTVTFTKKAAGEMRERILDMAAHLLSDPEEQKQFDQRIEDYYKRSEHKLYRPRPPRDAIATASAILASTQSLRIATIDAVLLEWMKKFPFEAGVRGSFTIPTPFELTNQRDEERIHRRAWYLTVESIKSDKQLSERWLRLRDKDLNLLDLELRIRELSKHESFLWLLERRRQADPKAQTFLAHPLPAESWDCSPQGFIAAMDGSLRRVCSLLSGARLDAALVAIEARELEALLELKVLSKSWEINKGTFRRPKRDAVEDAVEAIDGHARALQSYQARSELNELGDFLLQLYTLYEKEQQTVKHEMGRLCFSDLIKGGYHLFNRPEAAGVRFLLHRTIRHLLLDEFQDTSILQWSMFNAMAAEMLAGEGLRGEDELASSLFIVGDAKQSIYGFREAEAEVLDAAATYMLSRDAWDINLSASYRTAPGLLSYINEVFTERWAHFPRHSAAEKAPGLSVVPGAASLCVGPLFTDIEFDSEAEEVGASLRCASTQVIADEAHFVAQRIRHLLEDPATPPLWDKEIGLYRRLEARDCVLLYRAATQASVYAEALRSEGLPARLEEGKSFFERPEVLDLLAFCRWMSLPSHTEAFVHCLKSPLFRLQDSALLQALMQHSDREASRYERHLHLLDELESRYPGPVQHVRALLAQRHLQRPLGLLRWSADQLGWSQAYRSCFGAEEGLLAAANLNRFLETVSDLESHGIYDWLPLIQKLDELAEEQAISLASVSENAVQLMTIHKAKGLEFPLVALVGTGEEWEKTDPYWAKVKESQIGSGMAYVGRRSDRPAQDAHFEALERILHQASHEENLRLLYVALTRAQYHLLITGYRRKRYGAGFYQLLCEAAHRNGAETLAWHDWSVMARAEAPVGSIEPKPAAPAASHPFLTLASWQAPPAAWGSIQILAPARLLEGAEHSSAPDRATAHPQATAIGTFIHLGLEASVKAQDFPAAEVWEGLDDGSPDFASVLSIAQEKLNLILASPVFRSLIQESRQRIAERPIAFLQGDQLVRGTIDLLLERGPQHWLVVDYKTSEEARGVKDLRSLARAKRYDQQLALYVEGIRLLYPEARVDGAIFFTERLELLTYEDFRSRN